MKLSVVLVASAIGLANAAPADIIEARTQLQGCDVSGYQPNINWATVKAKGASFAIIKVGPIPLIGTQLKLTPLQATEGTTYKNPDFSSQYTGSYNHGLIRGAYHFAHPNGGSGAAQADYFLAHGGGWSADGKTLPGMLDLEYGPSSACWGLSHAAMVSWIHDFVNRYHSKTSRYPMIYTSTSWWTQCTGNSAAFGSTCPLVVARYASSVGTLPAGWGFYTFWQFADSGKFPGDQDVFNGDASRLKKLATG
jgi:GH25 family lysozyme M1 (1,4-beta-N-acetylmuramidase)